MAVTEAEWDDAIFYCEFMAKKQSFYLPALADPSKLTRARKKELITEYCETVVGNDPGAEVEATLKGQFAPKGESIRAAIEIIGNWKNVLLTKLTVPNLRRARCLQAIDPKTLEAVLVVWREKATELKLNLVANFTDNTSAGSGEMWISYKDIQNGAIFTMFALGHEFGHQTDFSIRDKYPEVLTAICPGWKATDHASWEYYADSFSTVYHGLVSGDRDRLVSGIEEYLKDEADDGVHPEGRLRVNQVRHAMASL